VRARARTESSTWITRYARDCRRIIPPTACAYDPLVCHPRWGIRGGRGRDTGWRRGQIESPIWIWRNVVKGPSFARSARRICERVRRCIRGSRWRRINPIGFSRMTVRPTGAAKLRRTRDYHYVPGIARSELRSCEW